MSQTPPSPAARRRPKWLGPTINVVLSLLLGGFFTWLALREVNWAKVGDILGGANYSWVAFYCVLMIAIHLIRVWRWGILLSPLGGVPFPKLMAQASVGFLAIVLLPFRMGEFVRPYLVSEKGGRVTFSGALATCVVERVIDALLVIGILFLTLATVKTKVPGWVITAATSALAVFSGLLVAVIVALWKRDASIRFWNHLIGVVSKRLAEKLTGILAAFIDGLRALQSAPRILGVVGLSLAYWGIAGLGLWVLFQALHMDLPPTAAFIVNGILVIGIMVPGGPGFTGPFEMAVRVALVELFAVSEDLNASYTILLHGLQFGFQLLVGLLFLFSRHVSFVRLAHVSAHPSETVEGSGG